MKKYKVKPVTIITEPNHMIKAEVFIIYFYSLTLTWTLSLSLRLR